MLRSAYYAGRYDPAEVNVVAKRVDPCLRNLHASPVWQRLARLPAELVVLVEAQDFVDWNGLRVYAGPDLAAFGEDGACEIVDWKTGRRRQEEGAREQLAGYAWFLQRRFGSEFVEGRWTARAVYLQDGEEEHYVVTRLDLIRAEHRILESAERMRLLLADSGANQPLARGAFPLTHPAFRFRCAQCAYYQLCEPELRGRADPKPARAEPPYSSGDGGG